MPKSPAPDRYDRPRDFIGYGESPPDWRWPGSTARVAVSLVINIEDGAERSRSRGDEADDVHAHWIQDAPSSNGNPSLESGFDYGSRAGVWRLLRIIDASHVPFTAFACGQALELNPPLADALASRGAEIVDHGLLWEPHSSLTRPELMQRMNESVTIIERLTGSAPSSWYSKDGHSRASLEIMNETRWLHDSNCFCEDMPYFTEASRESVVVIPYAADTNDSLLLTTISTGRQFESQLRAALETLCDDDRPGVRVLSIGLHPRWIGRPAYAASLQRFIVQALSKSDVVFAERRQIAAWWRSMTVQ